MIPILFADNSYRREKIYNALKAPLAAGGYTLQLWPDEITDSTMIEYAIIWYPPHGALQNLPNLKAIFSIAAGIDGVVDDASIPDHIPLIRTVDPFLTQGMVEYALLHALRYHRQQHIYEQQQHDNIWKQLPQIAPQERSIGIMGLGEIGSEIAKTFAALNFKTKGWSRTAKMIDGVECFAGAAALPEFLQQTEILLNVLPLTPATQNILNAELFNQLPIGAFVINMARGGHLVVPDLLAALATGQVVAATLDAFETEPLPSESPLWQHPQITITPHIASITRFDRVATNVMQQIKDYQAGKPWQYMVDRGRGY